MLRKKTLCRATRRPTTPRGVLIAAVWLGSFAQAVPATMPSEPDASATPASTRPEKIRELVTDLGYGADIKHVDAAVPYLTANVAPNDPTWTDSNPRWRRVSALIRDTLRADADAQFSESESAIVENAVRAMSDGVVREDLDASLAFFRSATGLKFLEFQRSLLDLSIQINLARDTTASSPSVESLDTRKRVLGLWFPIIFLRLMYGPEAADRAVDAAYRSFSRPRGRELDELARRYAEEIPQFEQFVQSASFRRIINAEKATERVMPEPDLAAFFSAEVRQHASEWKAAAGTT